MTEDRTEPRWHILLHRWRWAFVYALSTYGFWLVGLPLWYGTLRGFNEIDLIVFAVVFLLSPFTVPATLLFYTVAARPLYGESVSTILGLWAIEIIAFTLSAVVVKLVLARWR